MVRNQVALGLRMVAESGVDPRRNGREERPNYGLVYTLIQLCVVTCAVKISL